MKILFVSTTLEVVNRIIFQLAKRLKYKGIDVVILKYASARTCPLEGIKIYNFHTLIPPPKIIGHYLREKLAIVEIFLNILRICKKEKVDLIHVFTAFPAGPAASVYRNLTRIPFIITVTGGDVEVVREISYGCRLDPVNNKLISYALRSANLVIAPSPSSKVLAIEAGARQERVHVVPYAINLGQRFFNEPLTREKDRKLRVELGVDDNDTIILSLCRLIPRKGLKYLLQAFLEISNIHENIKLIIAGRGTEEKKLRKMVMKHNLMEKVFFVGFVNEAMKYMLFKLADVYVLPSLSETFAMSALEAMSCGTPLIMTKVGVATFLHGGEEYIGVRRRNMSELKNSMLKLILDDRLKAKIGKAARIRARELNYDNMSEKMVGIYTNVLSGSKQGICGRT